MASADFLPGNVINNMMCIFLFTVVGIKLSAIMGDCGSFLSSPSAITVNTGFIVGIPTFNSHLFPQTL